MHKFFKNYEQAVANHCYCEQLEELIEQQSRREGEESLYFEAFPNGQGKVAWSRNPEPSCEDSVAIVIPEIDMDCDSWEKENRLSAAVFEFNEAFKAALRNKFPEVEQRLNEKFEELENAISEYWREYEKAEGGPNLYALRDLLEYLISNYQEAGRMDEFFFALQLALGGNELHEEAQHISHLESD